MCKVYATADQAGAPLHNMVVLQAYQVVPNGLFTPSSLKSDSNIWPVQLLPNASQWVLIQFALRPTNLKMSFSSSPCLKMLSPVQRITFLGVVWDSTMIAGVTVFCMCRIDPKCHERYQARSGALRSHGGNNQRHSTILTSRDHFSSGSRTVDSILWNLATRSHWLFMDSSCHSSNPPHST